MLKVSHFIIRKYKQTLLSLSASPPSSQVFVILSCQLCPSVGRRDQISGDPCGNDGHSPCVPSQEWQSAGLLRYISLVLFKLTLESNRHKAQRII